MRNLIKQSALMILFLLMTSCSHFMMNRSYVTEMDHQTDGFFVAGRDFESIPGDSGDAYRTREEILLRTPATRKQQARRERKRSITSELERREGLLSNEEFALYKRRKVYFETESEKIYYLQLSRGERENYLSSKMIQGSVPVGRDDRSPSSLVYDRTRAEKQLFLGMNKNAVEKSWGSPTRVDVAGNPANQNERWTFYQSGKVRKIYFENGVVGGWTTE